jgi:hypothetical protein
LYLSDPEHNVWDAEEYIFENKDLSLMMDCWDEIFQDLFAQGF